MCSSRQPPKIRVLLWSFFFVHVVALRRPFHVTSSLTRRDNAGLETYKTNDNVMFESLPLHNRLNTTCNDGIEHFFLSSNNMFDIPSISEKEDSEKHRNILEAPEHSECTLEQEMSPSGHHDSYVYNLQKVRSVADFLVDVTTRSGVESNNESIELRKLISKRRDEYMNDLRNSESFPNPKSLLHYLAPKIPAIKHSPDILLRIKTSRSGIDPGVAACLIGTLGLVSDDYERKQKISHEPVERSTSVDYSITDQIISDRRFEQVLECLVCGIDVKYRIKEDIEQSTVSRHELNPSEMEQILSIEDVRYDKGLSIRDCCRAAWGISMLRLHTVENMGGVNIMELLLALALRSRELLLARMKLLRNGDLFDGIPTATGATVDDRIKDLSEEMAEDAAIAMWTFACVEKNVNMKCSRLFQVCESILCQDPYDLRRKAQNSADENSDLSVGTNDIVERLATSEALPLENKQRSFKKPTTETLFNYLSSQELKDVLWAQDIHWKKKHGSINPF